MRAFVCLSLAILSITPGDGSVETELPSSALPTVPTVPIVPTLKHFEDKLQPTYGDIIFTSILIRHGDRYPIHTFPKDELYEYFKEAGNGLLANKGRLRAFHLGLWTRARYAALLEGKYYNSGFLNAISSQMERTINSAQLFLAGFYPPGKKDQWNQELPWFPIAVYPIPEKQDNVLSLKAHCPRFDAEMTRISESVTMREDFFKKYTEEKFLRPIEDNTGLKIPRNDIVLAIHKLQALYDSFVVQENLGLGPPKWAKEVYPEPLRDMAKEYFKLVTHNDATKRLKAGPFTASVVNSMTKKLDNDPEFANRVFQLYSGHDMTLATIMNSWGIWDGNPPPYSAALFIELRQKDGQYNVTILYRIADDKEPTVLKIPGCKDPCTLDDFKEATSALIPGDWDAECHKFDPAYSSLLF